MIVAMLFNVSERMKMLFFISPKHLTNKKVDVLSTFLMYFQNQNIQKNGNILAYNATLENSHHSFFFSLTQQDAEPCLR